MKRPACVLFDLDDTLVRYDHAVRVQTLAARCGVTPDRIAQELFASGLEGAAGLGRYDAAGQAAELARRLGVAVTLDDCIASRAASTTPADDVIALASQVSKRARLAILSNNGLLVRDLLGTICPPLDALFAGSIFCSAEFGIGKPDPAIFLACARRLGLPPEAVLFVDDKAANAEGAAAAGMHAHHFRTIDALHATLREFDLIAETTDAP